MSNDDDFITKFGTKVWDNDSKTCHVYNNQHFTVVYASTGFMQKPQKYIISVERSTYEAAMVFNRQDQNTKQLFSLGVSF